MLRATGWAAALSSLFGVQQQRVSAFVPSASVTYQSRSPNRQPVVQLQGGGVQGSPAQQRVDGSDSSEADHEHNSNSSSSTEDTASGLEGDLLYSINCGSITRISYLARKSCFTPQVVDSLILQSTAAADNVVHASVCLL